MATLLTRFSRCLSGKAAYHRKELVSWAEEVIQDDSLVPTSELSDDAKLRYAMDLAAIQNRKFEFSAN